MTAIGSVAHRQCAQDVAFRKPLPKSNTGMVFLKIQQSASVTIVRPNPILRSKDNADDQTSIKSSIVSPSVLALRVRD